eukprot:jgi/Bigna1/80553/fgenesh1_pg.72_\
MMMVMRPLCRRSIGKKTCPRKRLRVTFDRSGQMTTAAEFGDGCKFFSIQSFTKSFTQQRPIGDPAVAAAVDTLRSGRLHRYNVEDDGMSQVASFEREYASYQGARYCVAVSSGGQAIQIALRAAGVSPGDRVLANAFTLAPVPGAIHAVGGEAMLVGITQDFVTDLGDLESKAKSSGAKYFLLSHMRGHIADMDAIVDLCKRHSITLVEDCAHTMGARWDGTPSGNHGKVACFSTQTYKHINSGEGGILTTNDSELAARAVIMSGSYMLYERHGAAPLPNEFDYNRVKYDMPNLSCRMDNLRAAILRPQLRELDSQVLQWNELYGAVEKELREVSNIRMPERDAREEHVGSSIQFSLIPRSNSNVLVDSKEEEEEESIRNVNAFVERCAKRGVDVKWFGHAEPHGFTSRFDSWRYIKNGSNKLANLQGTQAVLSTMCDVRLPLTFTIDDASCIGGIIREEASACAY